MVRTTRFGFDDGWTPDDVQRHRRTSDTFDDWPDENEPEDDAEPTANDGRTDRRSQEDATSERSTGRHLAGADWMSDRRRRRAG